MDDPPEAHHQHPFMSCACAILVFISFYVLAGAQRPARPSQLAESAPVKAQEEAFRQAQLKYDSVSAKAILADEFVGTGNHGEQVDKEQFLSLIGDKEDPLEVLEYGEMDIRVYGDTAVVWSTIHEKAVYSGKIDEYRGRRTALWIKRDMHWQCITIHTSRFEDNDKQKK
jgi:hypothetical protein